MKYTLASGVSSQTFHPLSSPSAPPTLWPSNLNKVREIVEKEGDDYVQKQGKEGHTFAHWAALGGHNVLLEYLLDKGAPLNDHSDNDYGPRPIHWACVHGHVIVVEMLLEKGVPIDVMDLNGCSPLIVAAQYGQSLMVSYLLQKGANKFHTDINGDTALHWAAFKGKWRHFFSGVGGEWQQASQYCLIQVIQKSCFCY